MTTFKSAIAALMLVSLIGCSATTVTRNGSEVTVVASGSAVFDSLRDIIDDAHAAFRASCPNGYDISQADTGAGLGQAVKPEPEVARKMAEAAKSFLDLLPSHSYTVTGKCVASQ